MAKKKVFNVYVMSLQGKPYKEKTHYTIKRWFAYYHVSREMACYLMYCNGCAYITGWNAKPSLSLKHDQLHACDINEARARKLTFCIAQSVTEYEQDTEADMIYPQFTTIGCDAGPFFDRIIAQVLEFMIKNEQKVEHSIDCDRWGAKESVPKGFYMIHTSGIEIKEGDYYWDTHTSRHRDCWVRVDKTYSAHKPGEKIGAVNWFGRILTSPIVIRRYEK